ASFAAQVVPGPQVRTQEPNPSVVAVSWGSDDLPLTLGSLLALGFSVQGPFKVHQALARTWDSASVLLLDVRAGSPSVDEIAELTSIGLPSVSLTPRDARAI